MFKIHFRNDMIPLIDKICQLLDCGREDLPEALENTRILTRLTDYLSSRGYLTTNHLRNNKEVCFDAFCLRGASTQIIFHNVTVADHMSRRHHIDLKYPSLPLIVHFGNNGHFDYYPLELLNYQRRRPSFYKNTLC